MERLAQAAAASSQPEKYRPKLQRAGKMLALLQVGAGLERREPRSTVQSRGRCLVCAPPYLQRSDHAVGSQADPAKAAGRLDERAVSQFRSTLDEVAKDVKQYRRYKVPPGVVPMGA